MRNSRASCDEVDGAIGPPSLASSRVRFGRDVRPVNLARLRRGDRNAVVVRLHGHRCVVAPGQSAGHAGSGKHAPEAPASHFRVKIVKPRSHCVLLHSALFFGALSALTTVAAFWPGLIRARFWFGLPAGLVLVALVTWNASILSGSRDLDMYLGIMAVVATPAVRPLFRKWSWIGAQLFAAAVLASAAYPLYAGSITYVVARDPVYLVASSLLLLLELAALTLSLSYLFEIIDTLSATSYAQHPADPGYLPKVALQVPAYNEPLEVVTETLNALAALDYPDLIVQVVDNNTPDRENWTALQALCEKLGPRFQFMHLENWPGYKAGALNEATRRLPKEVEVIGVVDSDYVVKPDWLRSMVGHFADPQVAFVQSPQNYRDWADDQYLRGLYYSYQYFFEITMPSRAHRNAIIFAGTMGLIRRHALQEIGGGQPDTLLRDARGSPPHPSRG